MGKEESQNQASRDIHGKYQSSGVIGFNGPYTDAYTLDFSMEDWRPQYGEKITKVRFFLQYSDQ